MIARVFKVFLRLAKPRKSAARLLACVLALCAIAISFDCSAFAQGPPSAQTVSADNISASGATLRALLSDNGSALIDCGFEYGVSEESLSRVSLPGKPTGSVSFDLTKLSPNTQYMFRSYASNYEGIVYGNLITFTTKELPAPPIIGEPAIVENDSSATLTFELETVAVLSVAVKYGESPKALALNADCSLSGSTLTVTLKNLQVGKTYYYECSASNEGGVTRGKIGELIFQGAPIPTADESPAPSASPAVSAEVSPSLTPEPKSEQTPEPSPTLTPEPTSEPPAEPEEETQPGIEAKASSLSQIGRFVLGESRPQDADERLRLSNMRLFYDPKDLRANLSAALALCDMGRSAEALIALRVAASGDETLSEALLLAGSVYLLKDDPASALDALSRIPDADSTPYAHYARAVALLRLGRRTDALSAANQAVAFAPDEQELYSVQFAALYSLGRYHDLLQKTELADNAFAIGYRIAALNALGQTDGVSALSQSLLALPESSAYERYVKAAAYAAASYANESLILVDSLKYDPHYLALLSGNPFFWRLAADIRWQFTTNDYHSLSVTLLFACLALLGTVLIVWVIGRPRKKKP